MITEQIMTWNDFRVTMFASLITTIVISMSIIGYAIAEERTDKQLIDEWNEMFGDDINTSENGIIPSDKIKISVMRGIYESMNNTDKHSAYQLNYETEQNKVLEIVRTLHNLIESTNDTATRAALEQTLENLKPRMAQVGIFMPEDIDDKELNTIHDQYQEEARESFRPSQMPKDGMGNPFGSAASVSGQYQTQMFLEYTCEPFVCRSAKVLDYVDPGESTNAVITVPSKISPVNILEWRIKVGNLQAGQWQSGYHQTIHYDENWNYKSGDVRSSNKYYPYNNYKQYTVYSVNNADAGDKTYQHLYFYL